MSPPPADRICRVSGYGQAGSRPLSSPSSSSLSSTSTLGFGGRRQPGSAQLFSKVIKKKQRQHQSDKEEIHAVEKEDAAALAQRSRASTKTDATTATTSSSTPSSNYSQTIGNRKLNLSRRPKSTAVAVTAPVTPFNDPSTKVTVMLPRTLAERRHLLQQLGGPALARGSSSSSASPPRPSARASRTPSPSKSPSSFLTPSSAPSSPHSVRGTQIAEAIRRESPPHSPSPPSSLSSLPRRGQPSSAKRKHTSVAPSRSSQPSLEARSTRAKVVGTNDSFAPDDVLARVRPSLHKSHSAPIPQQLLSESPSPTRALTSSSTSARNARHRRRTDPFLFTHSARGPQSQGLNSPEQGDDEAEIVTHSSCTSRELGRAQQWSEDIAYLMASIKPGESDDVLCIAITKLVALCQQRDVRRHMRAHGQVETLVTRITALNAKSMAVSLPFLCLLFVMRTDTVSGALTRPLIDVLIRGCTGEQHMKVQRPQRRRNLTSFLTRRSSSVAPASPSASSPRAAMLQRAASQTHKDTEAATKQSSDTNQAPSSTASLSRTALLPAPLVKKLSAMTDTLRPCLSIPRSSPLPSILSLEVLASTLTPPRDSVQEKLKKAGVIDFIITSLAPTIRDIQRSGSDTTDVKRQVHVDLCAQLCLKLKILQKFVLHSTANQDYVISFREGTVVDRLARVIDYVHWFMAKTSKSKERRAAVEASIARSRTTTSSSSSTTTTTTTTSKNRQTQHQGSARSLKIEAAMPLAPPHDKGSAESADTRPEGLAGDNVTGSDSEAREQERASVQQTLIRCLCDSLRVLLCLSNNNDSVCRMLGLTKSVVKLTKLLLVYGADIAQEHRHDVFVLGLSFLSNLAEHLQANRKALLGIAIEDSDSQFLLSQSPSLCASLAEDSRSEATPSPPLAHGNARGGTAANLDILGLLVSHFLACVTSDDGGSDAGKRDEVSSSVGSSSPPHLAPAAEVSAGDLDATVKDAEKITSNNLIGAYTAILFACLCKEPEAAEKVRVTWSKQLVTSMMVHIDEFLQYQHSAGMGESQGLSAIEALLSTLHALVVKME